VTLLELLIALTILTLAAALAAPAFSDWVKANRVRTQATSLALALTAARDIALLQRREVVVCASSNGTACATQANWSSGWVAFESATNTIVASAPALAGGSTIVSELARVTFRPSGEPDLAASFLLRPSGCQGRAARLVAVGRSGLVSEESTAC
jgi:type IV fimbrial biogenesis protein FimT